MIRFTHGAMTVGRATFVAIGVADSSMKVLDRRAHCDS